MISDNKYLIPLTGEDYTLPSSPWDTKKAGEIGERALKEFRADCKGFVGYRWCNGKLVLSFTNKKDAERIAKKITIIKE